MPKANKTLFFQYNNNIFFIKVWIMQVNMNGRPGVVVSGY